MFNKLFTILLLIISFTYTQTLPVLVGGCKGTQFGCCNQTQVVCLDTNCSHMFECMFKGLQRAKSESSLNE